MLGKRIRRSSLDAAALLMTTASSAEASNERKSACRPDSRISLTSATVAWMAAPRVSGDAVRFTRSIRSTAFGWLEWLVITTPTGCPGLRWAIGYSPGWSTAPTTAAPRSISEFVDNMPGWKIVPSGIEVRTVRPTTNSKSAIGTKPAPWPLATSTARRSSISTVEPEEMSRAATATAVRLLSDDAHRAKMIAAVRVTVSPRATQGSCRRRSSLAIRMGCVRKVGEGAV